MKHEKQAHFLPGEIDEQIDYYLEPRLSPESTANAQTISPTENAARQTVQSLQQYFAPSEDATERIQRVWQRLESRQAQLDAQSIQYSEHPISQITDLSQVRERRMPRHAPPADGPIASRRIQRFSRLNTLIAVACAIMLVGGAIFALQRLYIGPDKTAAKQTPLPTMTEDAGLYTYTELGEYYRLDPVTHKELWHFIVPQGDDCARLSRPIVKSGLLYMLNAGKDGCDVYVLNTSNGLLKWKTQVISSADEAKLSVSLGDLIVTNDTIYYAVYSAHDGYSILHSLSAVTGKSNWEMRYDNTGTINDASAGMIIQGVTANVLYAATLTGAYASPDMKLYAIDLRNSGKLLWSTSVPFIPNSGGVAILGGVAFNGVFYYGGPGEGTDSSALYAYNIHGVQQKFTLPGSYQVTSVVEANSILYAGTSHQNAQGEPDAGSVYAIRPQDGKVLWQYFHQGNGGSSTPTVQNGIVYVTFSAINNIDVNSALPVVALNVTDGHSRWYREIPKGVGNGIQPLIDSSFVYLVRGRVNPYGTMATLLKLSDGSPAGSFTVHSDLNTEGSFLEIVP